MDLTTICALRNRRLLKRVTAREAMRGSDSKGGGQ